MTIKTSLAGLAATLLAGTALAHDGHGDHDALGVLATLAHPLTVQQALTLLLLACVLGRLALMGLSAQHRAKRPLALGLLAGAVAVASGLALLARA